MKKVLFLSCLFAVYPLFGEVSVSTQVYNKTATIAVPAKSGDRVVYGVRNVSTAITKLEKSVDGSNWDVVLTTTAINSDPALLGSLGVTRTEFYRLRVSSITTGSIRMDLYAGPVESVAAISGNSSGKSYPAYLWNGTALEGSVLVSSSPKTGYGYGVEVATAGLYLINVVGIAKSPASSYTVVDCYYDGLVMALTTGTVNAGDLLFTSTNSAGYLERQNAVQSGAIVGQALADGTTSGGLTKIRLRK